RRRGHAGAGGQLDIALGLCAGLPFAAAPGGRDARSILTRAHPAARLRLRELFESPSHDLGLAEPLLRRLLRYLRADVLDGIVDRSEDLLTARYEAHEHDVLVIGAGGA